MKEIPLTKGHITTVDDEDYPALAQHKWLYHNGYAARSVGTRRNHRFLFMHNVIMQPPPGQQTDHVNLDKLDNRRCNLRHCTPSQNNANGPSKGGTSRYKGVSRATGRGKLWLAQIQAYGKMYRLGQFDDEIAAAHAYDAAARKHFGEFARCNFPLEDTSYAEL